MGALADLTKSQRKKLPHRNIVEYKDAIYHVYKDNDSGKIKTVFVCSPIDVPMTYYDIVSGDTYYIFVNPMGIAVKIQPSVICSLHILELADKGFEVSVDNAVYFTQYLLNLISLSHKEPSYKYLGFYRYEGEIRFFWDKMYPVGLRQLGVYQGDFNISSNGTVKEWRNGVKRLVEGHPPLELALVCAFAALLMGYIGKERAIDSSVIHFWGDSSTGKSTAAKLDASVFGSPDIADGALIGSWFSTANAIVESTSNLYGILRVLDDTSAAMVKDMEAMIYKLSMGKDKGRLSGDIEQVQSGTWRTIILTTGESPILDDNAKAGASARTVQINLPLTKSAEHSQAINEFVSKQYGTAVTYFARKLLKSGQEQILQYYDRGYRSILKKLGDKKLNDRLCKLYTLILLACKLVNEYFKLTFNYKAIRSLIIDANNSRKTDDDFYEDILIAILEELSIRQNEIDYKRKRMSGYYRSDEVPRNRFIGKMHVNAVQNKIDELTINRQVVDGIIDKAVKHDRSKRNQVYQYFKEKGYILTYKNGFAKKSVIGNIRVPCICFNTEMLLNKKIKGRKNHDNNKNSPFFSDEQGKEG